jgi:hypothetical protein
MRDRLAKADPCSRLTVRFVTASQDRTAQIWDVSGIPKSILGPYR